VAGNHVRIDTRVSSTDLCVAGKNIFDLIAREQAGRAKSPDETFVRGDLVERLGKWRQCVEPSERSGKKGQRLRGRKETASIKSMIAMPSSALQYRTRGAKPASAAAVMQAKIRAGSFVSLMRVMMRKRNGDP